jgi:hypothetical protein
MVKNFGFELIVSFGANFQVVRGYDYVLQDVYGVFFFFMLKYSWKWISLGLKHIGLIYQ